MKMRARKRLNDRWQTSSLARRLRWVRRQTREMLAFPIDLSYDDRMDTVGWGLIPTAVWRAFS